MKRRHESPYEEAQAWRVVLGAIGFGTFLFILLSALYIVDGLFNG